MGTHKFALDTETNWKAQASQKYYSLGSIWYFLTMKDENISNYIRGANNKNVEMVSRIDRDTILEYFEGQTELNQIDKFQTSNKDFETNQMAEKNEEISLSVTQ